jgi:DNA-binding transcriptional LysR family regulator
MPLPIARASDGEAVRRLALGEVGLARLAMFHIDPDIETERFVPVLMDFNPGDREDIHGIHLGQGDPLPAHVLPSIDFFADRVRIPSPP